MFSDFGNEPALGARSRSLGSSVLGHGIAIAVLLLLNVGTKNLTHTATRVALFTPVQPAPMVKPRPRVSTPVVKRFVAAPVPQQRASTVTVPPAPVVQIRTSLSEALPPSMPVAQVTPKPAALPTVGFEAPAKPKVPEVSRIADFDTKAGLVTSAPARTISAAGFSAVQAGNFASESRREVSSSGFAAAQMAEGNSNTRLRTIGGSFDSLPVANKQQEVAQQRRVTPGFDSISAAQPAQSNQPKTIANGAQTPLEILGRPKSEYTEDARKRGIEGDVVLEVMFTGAGEVRIRKIIQGLGHGLDENAIRAVSHMPFRPAKRDGRPVDSVAIVRVSFQLAS